jgi:hypothetical protein
MSECIVCHREDCGNTNHIIQHLEAQLAAANERIEWWGKRENWWEQQLAAANERADAFRSNAEGYKRQFEDKSAANDVLKAEIERLSNVIDNTWRTLTETEPVLHSAEPTTTEVAAMNVRRENQRLKAHGAALREFLVGEYDGSGTLCCVVCAETGPDRASIRHAADCILAKPHPGEGLRPQFIDRRKGNTMDDLYSGSLREECDRLREALGNLIGVVENGVEAGWLRNELVRKARAALAQPGGEKGGE